MAAWPAATQDAAPFAVFEGASEPILNDPHDLVFGPDGRLYIADKFGSRIVVMDPDTLEIVEVIAEGILPGVHDISFGPDGRAYVAVTGHSAVAIFSFTGGAAKLDRILTGFPRTEGALAHSNGRLYVMATGVGVLAEVVDDKATRGVGGMPGAHDVEEAPDGTIWVADNFGRRIVHFSTELEFLGTLEGMDYGFIGPRYLAFDEAGMMIVADQDAHRVLRIDPASGILLGVLGAGEPGIGANFFDDPEGAVARGARYWFSDSDNNRIVRYVVVIN